MGKMVYAASRGSTRSGTATGTFTSSQLGAKRDVAVACEPNFGAVAAAIFHSLPAYQI
jgi:hypothetical protein